MATTGAGSPYVTGTDNITGYPTTSLALANRVDAVESGAAAALTSGLAAKYDNAPAINAQTGTTYTFVLADATAGKTITASNAAASTYTVPPQSSVTFVAGALLRVTNLGAGVVTFAGGSGVTVTNAAATLRQYQSATLVRTGSDAWTVSADIASGMDLITPTSVAGSGVTLSGGQVSIASSTTISVNGCFTATYDTYRIVLYMTTGGTGALAMRLRVAASDNSTSNYTTQRLSAGSTSVVGTRSASQTSWFGHGMVTGINTLQIDIQRPFLTTTTTALVSSGRGTDANLDMDNFFMGHNTATSFDGFTIDPGSAATGTMRVYGLRNS